VLSFGRLAARVLAETGTGFAPVLDELGRRMLLAGIVAQKESELTVFRGAAGRRGFAARLSRTISECNAQGVRAHDLQAQERAAAAAAKAGKAGSPGDSAAAGAAGPSDGQPILSGKLHDLALLIAAYRESLAGSYIDPEETLDIAADRLESVEFLRGAQVWVDGFAGFTPQQYAVLCRILAVAADVRVALCLDPALATAGGGRQDPASAGLFAPTLGTYNKLRSLARQVGAACPPPVLLPLAGQPVRFRPGGGLAHLEACWHRPRAFELAAAAPGIAGTGAGAAQKAAASAVSDGPRLVVATDQRAEVTAAAAEMVRLCRDQGYQWRQISVLVPDMDSYHDLLQSVFSDHGIPCFLDRRRPVPYHPLVEFLRSAVEVCLTNWAPEPVFRWLKTDLGPLGREDVDLLENYVIRHGLRGRRWVDGIPWEYRAADQALSPLGEDAAAAGPHEDSLAAVNRARARVVEVVGPLFHELQRAARAPTPARELVSSLAALLERTGAATTLARWRDEEVAAGHPEQAQEQEEVWRRVTRLLEQAYAALGETPLRLGQFADVLETGLESLTLGLVPPSLDQVVCGTVERSRQPDVRATFVLGANQGSLPSAPAEDLVFSDREREALASHGLELAPTARERSFHQRYLTYIALTRPSEYLWVSWPARQGEGEPRGPAAAVTALKLLFPGIEETPAGGSRPSAKPEPPTDLDLAAQRTARVISMARQGQRLHPGWLDLYSWLVGDAGRRATVEPSLRGLGWRNEPLALPGGLARALFGSPVRGSASRIERFADCPFAHFAGDGLRLEPRPRQQVRAPELGTFFHAVLQAFFNELRHRELAFHEAADDQIAAAAAAALDAITPRLQSEVLLSSGRYRYLARILARTVRRTVWWLGRHARRSAFRTVAVEVGFGLPGSRFGPLDLGAVSLRGVVDRIDLAEESGRRLVRIIDYKSGSSSWNLPDVVHDLKLQLLLYLAAALEMLPGVVEGPVEVAGVFLFPVRDRLLRLASADLAAAADDLRAKDLRPDGLVLNDPAVVRLMDRAAEEAGAIRLFPFAVAADGHVTGKQAVSAGQLAMLARFARVRAVALAERIAAGEDALRPWRRGDRRACTYCDFHPVCAFDPSLAANRYRELHALTGEQIWDAVEAAAAEGAGDRSGAGAGEGAGGA
jgi:ATP-dependent helicase/nuclease subunit B